MSKKFVVPVLKFQTWIPFKQHHFCTLYSNSPVGSTNAVTRHMSFV